MTEAGRRWVAQFEKEGWFRFGQVDPNADLAGVGVSYVGGDKTILGLADVVEVSDEFLVFEYGYEVSPPDGNGGTAGRARIWIPWNHIQFVFRTRIQSEI